MLLEDFSRRIKSSGQPNSITTGRTLENHFSIFAISNTKLLFNDDNVLLFVLLESSKTDHFSVNISKEIALLYINKCLQFSININAETYLPYLRCRLQNYILPCQKFPFHKLAVRHKCFQRLVRLVENLFRRLHYKPESNHPSQNRQNFLQ